MKKIKKELKEVEICEDIICNKCGNSCLYENDFYGIQIEYYSGYYSKYFSDMEHIQFDLCEKCLKELYDSCKIKPENLTED